MLTLLIFPGVEIYPFSICDIFTLMSQPSPPPLGTECLSCRSNGSWDDWSGGEETRVVKEPTAFAGLHTLVHACAVCMLHPWHLFYICLFARVHSFGYRVWLYSKGDSRTLGTTLTWPVVGPCRMPVTVWHEWWGPEVNNKQAQRELNPTPAYCHTSFPQICTWDVVFTLKYKLSTDKLGFLCSVNEALHCLCLCSSHNRYISALTFSTKEGKSRKL